MSSLAAGGPAIAAGVPGLISVEQHPSIRRHLLTSCFASHIADLGLLAATAVALLRVHEPVWAVAVALAGTLAAYGSLQRLGSERAGARISRSVIERLVRNGSLGVTLVLAASLDGSSVVVGVPVLAVAGLGFAAYGLFEVLRSTCALFLGPNPRAAVTMVVTENDGTRISGFGEATHNEDRHLELVANG